MPLLPHRRRPPLPELRNLGLLLVDALVQEFGVFGLVLVVSKRERIGIVAFCNIEVGRTAASL